MAVLGEWGKERSVAVASKGAAPLALRGARPGWQELSTRYPEDRDCLASFLALELAEVLHEAKPANLVCLTNKRRSCGRNLYLLWKEHGPALLEEAGLKVKVLADRGSSILLLLYSHDALSTLLAQKSVRVILGKAGYRDPEDFAGVLSELEQRVGGVGFPHEIGVFLGYPLKDVVGSWDGPSSPSPARGPGRSSASRSRASSSPNTIVSAAATCPCSLLPAAARSTASRGRLTAPAFPIRQRSNIF